MMKMYWAYVKYCIQCGLDEVSLKDVRDYHQFKTRYELLGR